MSDLNACTISGNLGRDPELNYTPNGTPIAKCTLANNQYAGGKGQDIKTNTTWFNLVLWGKQAEFFTKYAKKGMKVTAVGEVCNRAYVDREGAKRTTLELTVRGVQLPYVPDQSGEQQPDPDIDPLGDIDDHPF